MTRTAQDILAERRSVVQEQRRETDKTARAILQFQIDELDRELAKVSTYTHFGNSVTPLWRTKRSVSGGTCVDIIVHDPRCTITHATVNVDNIEVKS